ncbi:MAG: nucleoside deaminase [Chloroflexota bacterium]
MEIILSQPEWAIEALKQLPTHFDTLEEKMRAVIRFSRLNFEHDTGGPFAAGVFERDTGKLVVIGVNRVVPSNCSSAHAEIMTLSLAQKLLGTFDLGGANLPAHQLVVNWLPCAMCFGSLAWSGIRSLVIAGSGSELEDITGFDEGPIHPNWVEELNKRGIHVTDNILTEEACDVFRDFANSDRLVYNGRLGGDN